MDDDPIEWGKRQRRKNALRVLIVGMIVMAAGGWYYYANRDWGLDKVGDATVVHRGAIDPRLIGGAALAVGGLLAIAGIVMFARSRRTPPPHDD